MSDRTSASFDDEGPHPYDYLRDRLADMTAERDESRLSMEELRKVCAEIIGADPQTWPDHGNAPLAIAACLGLRDAELQKTTAERDAALAKVAALRDALTGIEQFFSQPGEAISEKFERIGYAFHKATGMLRPGKDASMHCPHTYDEREKAFDDWCTAKAAAARNALESTK